MASSTPCPPDVHAYPFAPPMQSAQTFLLCNVIPVPAGSAGAVVGRVLARLARAQALGTLVERGAVPVGLAEHGEAKGCKVLVGERGVDAIRHNGLLLFRLTGRRWCCRWYQLVQLHSRSCIVPDGLELFRDGQAEVALRFPTWTHLRWKGRMRPRPRAARCRCLRRGDLRCAPRPTSRKMSTLRQMPLKPTALDSFLSLIAHMMPVT